MNLFLRTTTCLVTVLLLLLPSLVCAEQSAKIVAKVGGIPVTIFELERSIQKIAPLRSSFHSGISEEKIQAIRQEALDGLIDRAYKVRGAIDQELTVDIELLNNKMSKIRTKFNSDKEFNAAFGDEGRGGYRAYLYRGMLSERAEDVNVDDVVRVSDTVLRSYYEKNKHTYVRPQQYRASHILVKVDPASNEDEFKALEARAEKLLKRAKNNEDFFNLAYYNSDDRSKMVGGDIGYFHDGQTVTAFENAVKSLTVGEISDLVRSRWGFHIVKLVEKNPSQQLGFDDVKTKIRSGMEKDLKEELYAKWMKSLKSKYVVETY